MKPSYHLHSDKLAFTWLNNKFSIKPIRRKIPTRADVKGLRQGVHKDRQARRVETGIACQVVKTLTAYE